MTVSIKMRWAEVNSEHTANISVYRIKCILSYKIEREEYMREHTDIENSRWMENFKCYRGYVGSYHKNPLAGELWHGHQVGNWLVNQRTAYNKGIMSCSRINTLDNFNRLWRANKKETEEYNKKVESQKINELSNRARKNGQTPLTGIKDITHKDIVQAIKNKLNCCEDIVNTPNSRLKNVFKHSEYYLKARALHAIQPNIALSTLRFIHVWLENFGEGLQLDKLGTIFNVEQLDNNVSKVLARINTRDREILIYYYGLEDGKKSTLAECALKYNISRARANQIVLGSLRLINQSGAINIIKHRSIVEEQRVSWCKQQEAEGKTKSGQFKGIQNNRIELLSLKTGTYNALKRAGVNSLYDLLALKKETIMRIRQIGEKDCIELMGIQNRLLGNG